MSHDGFTLNRIKNSAKRKEALLQRIKHLKEQIAVIEDQIDIMKGEIRLIDAGTYIDSLENQNSIRSFFDVI